MIDLTYFPKNFSNCTGNELISLYEMLRSEIQQDPGALCHEDKVCASGVLHQKISQAPAEPSDMFIESETYVSAIMDKDPKTRDTIVVYNNERSHDKTPLRIVNNKRFVFEEENVRTRFFRQNKHLLHVHISEVERIIYHHVVEEDTGPIISAVTIDMDSGEIVKRNGPRPPKRKDPSIYTYGDFDVKETMDLLKNMIAEKQKQEAREKDLTDLMEGLKDTDTTGIEVYNEYIIIDGLKLKR